MRMFNGRVAYFQSLSHAKDNLQASVQSRLCFARDELNDAKIISFAEKKNI